jgi:hypothetical protein
MPVLPVLLLVGAAVLLVLWTALFRRDVLGSRRAREEASANLLRRMKRW